VIEACTSVSSASLRQAAHSFETVPSCRSREKSGWRDQSRAWSSCGRSDGWSSLGRCHDLHDTSLLCHPPYGDASRSRGRAVGLRSGAPALALDLDLFPGLRFIGLVADAGLYVSCIHALAGADSLVGLPLRSYATLGDMPQLERRPPNTKLSDVHRHGRPTITKAAWLTFTACA
jgi:hypothetical protein